MGPSSGQGPPTATTPTRPRNSPRSRRSRCCRASSSCGSAWSRCGGTTASTTRTISTCPAGGRSGTTAAPTARPRCPRMTLEPSNLFIVADGMGGQQAGEQASLMAVELIPRAIARRLPPDENEPSRIKEAIRDAVAEVNQEILGSSGAVTEFSNMGTTVVLAQFRYDRVYVAGHRRLARLPAPRRPARAAHQGPLAGRRPARGRHDHRRGAAHPQVQERAVSLPRQQGCPRRPGGRPGPRRPARRPAAAWPATG